MLNDIKERLLSRLNPTLNAFSFGVTNVRQRLVGANAGRTKLVIQNLSASPIEIGDSGLTFGQGFQIAANTTYFDDIDPFAGEWYVIAGVAGPLDIRVRDEGRNIG